MAQEREWEIMQEEQSGVEEGQDIEGDMENLEYWRQKKISINKIDLSTKFSSNSILTLY